MRVLYIEPFCGGSHATFTRILVAGLRERHGLDVTELSLPGRHWKWRMRGAVVWLAQERGVELRGEYDLVFASSYLPLAELIGLHPHLGAIPRILYFHENQLVYPVREEFSGPRDRHYGFTQMVSALAATRCVFNSRYNMESFLAAGDDVARSMPDARPVRWGDTVRARSEVLGLPMELPAIETTQWADDPRDDRTDGPILLWNHRWEHDKNPAEYFAVLADMRRDGVPFRLIVCGESYQSIPSEMTRARAVLADRIVHWGYVADRVAYEALLRRAHMVVSTAVHEFFGLAVLEAMWMGARPVVPNRLCYPELIPAEFRYEDLRGALEPLCLDWAAGRLDLRADRRDLVDSHGAERVLPRYRELFDRLIGANC